MGAAAVVPLMAVSTALAAGGTAYSVYQQRSNASRQAQAAANVASDAILRGTIEEAAARRRAARLAATQRSRYAASGVAIAEGSPANVLLDTAALGELDALTIRSNAARSAWGYQTQSLMSQAEGREATTAGGLSVFSTILGGSTSIAGYRANHPR